MQKIIRKIKQFARLPGAVLNLQDKINQLSVLLDSNANQLTQISALIESQKQETLPTLLARELQSQSNSSRMDLLSQRFKRNYLPNDSSALHKLLITEWKKDNQEKIGYLDILASGFRVFSQNDEDGILLRIFSHIGTANQCVIEIGSNCNGSDIGIPENLSTNLIVNHGWHGIIFDIDEIECDRIRYFFAREAATKHFHLTGDNEQGCYSPLIFKQEITPSNINELLVKSSPIFEPDLMILDIDGGDYKVLEAMQTHKPRVLVVEFEKRFRDRFSVFQPDRKTFGQHWPQSGSVSLPAWEKILTTKGYSLCAIGTCGFNAFFVRADIAAEKFHAMTSAIAFDLHPIFSKVSESFWLEPDQTWCIV